jgi:serine phosphatase RsbU (regulator of sigma subunit)
MEIEIAVAKTNKFNSIESGDTLETVERPNGGISVVLADAQFSGKQAKAISTLVVHKVITLLAEGVRDGAAARAASDFLYTERKGSSPAYLNILSVDLETSTLVIVRNNITPILVVRENIIESLSGTDSAIGVSRNMRPVISEINLQPGITIVIYTDGLINTGKRYGESFDIRTLLDSLLEEQEPSSQEIADLLLAEAIRLDQGQPSDDMSVVVLRINSHAKDQIRRMNVLLPVNPNSSQ